MVRRSSSRLAPLPLLGDREFQTAFLDRHLLEATLRILEVALQDEHRSFDFFETGVEGLDRLRRFGELRIEILELPEVRTGLLGHVAF